MFQKIVFLLIAAITPLAISLDADANQGFYVGLGTAFNTIQGDFNGSSVLQGGSSIIAIPDIDNAFGIDIYTGSELNEQ